MAKDLLNQCIDVEIQNFKVKQSKNPINSNYDVAVDISLILIDSTGDMVSNIVRVGPKRVERTLASGLAVRRTFDELYGYRDQIFQGVAIELVKAKIQYAGIDEVTLRADFGDTVVDTALGEMA